MNNTLNIITDDPIWNQCGFETNQASRNIFDTVLSYMKAQKEIDFLESGKNICVNLSLSNDKEIQKLNREFRGLDKPTNVLSFAAIDDPDFDKNLELFDDIEIGDIIIALETMQREAKEKGISLQDHFCHLFTHGILHLLGFDHMEDDEAEYMEDFEINILKNLNIKNPYGD